MKIITQKTLFITCLFFATNNGFALTISEAVDLSQKSSKTILINKAAFDSSKANAESLKAVQLPKLSIDGNYRYQSELSTIQMGQTQIETQDNNSYSIGPTLSYTLWDSGLKNDLAKAATFQADAKGFQYQLSKIQVRLATRIAYIKAVLANEVKIISESALNLSKSQNADIRSRHKNGTATNIDMLSSDSEVLNYDLRLKQSLVEKENAESDLIYYISNDENASKFDNLQNLDQLISIVSPSTTNSDLNSHPQIEKQKQIVESNRLLALAQKANYWPTLSLQVRSSWDYPSGVPFSKVNQNSAGVFLTWSLWDFGATKHSVASKEADVQVSRYQFEDLKKQMMLDQEKSVTKIQSLSIQMRDAATFAEKQAKVAKLNYDSYNFGRLSYTDVETANLKLLEAKNRLATIQAQYLIEYFNLQYLQERE